jgi:hypothetical protein
MLSEAAMAELSPADTQALIAYAKAKFAEERFPLAPSLGRLSLAEVEQTSAPPNSKAGRQSGLFVSEG